MANTTRTVSGCQPLIIVAAPHSGGELLGDLLTQLPDVAMWSTEVSNSVWRYSQAALNHDELTVESASDDVCRYLQGHFARRAKASGAKFLVDVTPANSLRVDFVQRVLPTARFLFVVRDGRDIIEETPLRPTPTRRSRFGQTPTSDLPHYFFDSMKTKLANLVPRKRSPIPNGPQFRGMTAYVRRFGYLAAVAKQWAVCVSKAAQAFEEMTDEGLSQWGDDVVLPLQYEAFVEEPIDELWDVCDFIGYDVEEGTLESICAHVSTDSVGRWKSSDTCNQLDGVAEILNPLLAEFGYSTVRSLDATQERRAA